MIYQKSVTFSELCIMIHICEKDKQDAHFFLIIYFTYIVKKKCASCWSFSSDEIIICL